MKGKCRIKFTKKKDKMIIRGANIRNAIKRAQGIGEWMREF